MTGNQQLRRTLDPTVVWLVTALPLAVLTAVLEGGRKMGPAFISALSLWLLLVPLLVAAGRSAVLGLNRQCARHATTEVVRPLAARTPCRLYCRLTALLSR